MRMTEVLLLVPAALAFAQAPVSPPPGVCSIRLLEMKPPAVDPHFEIATPDPKQFASLNVKPPAPPCPAASAGTERPAAQNLRSVPPPPEPSAPESPAPQSPASQSPAGPPAPPPAK